MKKLLGHMVDRKKIYIACLVTLGSIPLYSGAQVHKGISFQGVIKLPSGEYPTRQGLVVNGRILSPNNCILREEQFSGVNISNGYINLSIGSGTVLGNDPGFDLKGLIDNSKLLTDLVCLNSDGSVNSSVTTFNPSSTNGARKFRLSLYIDSTPVVADFNMRAVAYAVNAETLDGKNKTDFIQTNTNVTQSKIEGFLSALTSGSGNSVKWNGSSFESFNPTDGSSLTSVSGNSITSLSYSKLTGVPSNLTEIGGLSCIDGKVLKKVAGSWSCADVVEGVSGIQSLTGDVTASGTGAVSASVNSVGGSTAENIHNAEVLANASTNLNVASSIVRRDSSGNFTAGTITANMVGAASLNVLKSGDNMSGNLVFDSSKGTVFKAGSGANTVSIEGPAGAIGLNYVLRLPTAPASVDGQVLTSDTSGNLTWTTPTAAATSYVGTLPVANGGTNSSTALNNNRVMVSSGGSIVEGPSLANGQILIGSTGASPQSATLTAGTGINILNAAGAITISTNLSSGMLSDGGSLIKADQMPSNCSASQTLTFSSPSGTWVCQTIQVTGASFGNQNANLFFAGPSTGGAAAPSFRAIASADLPAGTISGSGTTNYVPFYSAASTLANSPIMISGTNVGVGVTPSGAKLHISGSLKIADGTQAAGRVLTSDANGKGTWQDLASEVPVYNVATRSADFNASAATNYTYYLVSGSTTATLPGAGAAGAGFVVGFKRVGSSNVTIVGSDIDGASSMSLLSNYAHVKLLSDGSKWHIIEGGATLGNGGCSSGSQTYPAGSSYSLVVSASQAENCTYTITVLGAGGGNTTNSIGGKGGGLVFTYKPSAAGSFDILVGSKGEHANSAGTGGYGGGGKGTSGSSAGGGGASAVAYSSVVLGVAGGGGGAGQSSFNTGAAGGSGGAAGSSGSGGSYPGVGGGNNVGGASPGSTNSAGGSNSSAGGGGGGAAYTTFAVSGGGSPTSGGFGGGGGGYGGGSSGSGGGGGGGYINSGAVLTFGSVNGVANAVDGSVKIEWN